MSEEKKNNKKKGGGFDFEFKFNFYWVYVIIAILFIAMTFAPDLSSESRTLDKTAFEELVQSQDVKKIVVINICQ